MRPEGHRILVGRCWPPPVLWFVSGSWLQEEFLFPDFCGREGDFRKRKVLSLLLCCIFFLFLPFQDVMFAEKSTMYLLKLVIQLTGFIICVIISPLYEPICLYIPINTMIGPYCIRYCAIYVSSVHVTFPSGVYVHTNVICNLCVWLSFWNITILCRYIFQVNAYVLTLIFILDYVAEYWCF